MGQTLAKTLSGLSRKSTRILMVGLDAAGKTTMLYHLAGATGPDGVLTTIPTIGFNVETIKYKNVDFTIWDVGSRDKIRPLWRHYYQGANVLIFMIDANDRDRIELAGEEFIRIFSEDMLRDALFVVIANKMDLPKAMKIEEIIDNLGFKNQLHSTNRWACFPAVARNGEGLYEILEWIRLAMNTSPDQPLPPTTYSSETFKKAAAAEKSSSPPPPPPFAAAAFLEQKIKSGEISDSTTINISDDDFQQKLRSLLPYSVENDPIGWNPQSLARVRWEEKTMTRVMADNELLMAMRGGEGEEGEEGGVENVEMETKNLSLEEEEKEKENLTGGGEEGRKMSVLTKFEYCHELMLRCMWIHLSRMTDRSKGRQKAVNAIMSDIKKCSERLGQIFHMTHTYFWLQMVDLSLQMSEEMRQISRSDYVVPENPQFSHDFDVFLSKCPWLVDNELMTKYYSHHIVFSDEESVNMFKLPDLRQLPSILSFSNNKAKAAAAS